MSSAVVSFHKEHIRTFLQEPWNEAEKKAQVTKDWLTAHPAGII